MNKKNLKKILPWIFVIVFEIIIFYFSNMNTYESNSKSMECMNKIMNITIEIAHKINLVDNIPSSEDKQILIETLNVPFRKIIHFSIYFILAILIIHALYNSTKNDHFKIKWTLIICFLLAMADEYHQTFINGRTGSFKDVLIDTTGSIVGIYMYQKIKNKLQK